MRRFLVALTLGIVMVLALATPVSAQETGSLSGFLIDPDGVPLPGVTVTVAGSLIPSATRYTQANGHYRFPTLPPGDDYSLTFELQGFQTIVQEGAVVRLDGDTRVNVSMRLGGLEETVTVSGSTPLIDVKKTGVGNNITERYLQSIPSARDPWVMLEHTGGVQVDNANVGGSESGGQSNFTANGSHLRDTVWTYDGIETTAAAGTIGSSSMYYDFGALEEISVSTAGNDPSVATGGVRLNFVTKRGGNTWRGSGRLYLTDGALQTLNVGDPETGDLVGSFGEGQLYPGYIGNSIDNIKDWGAELGGPALREKLFVWGAFGKQDIKTAIGTNPDNTQLTNWHGKANWHAGDRAVASFTLMYTDKTKQGRGASARKDPESTWNQTGGDEPIYSGKLQYTFDESNYVEVSANRVPGTWALEPRGGRDVQMSYDLATGYLGRTVNFREVDGSTTAARVDGNSYVSGSGSDHEIRYGYSFRAAEESDKVGYPQGTLAAFWRGFPVEAWLGQDSIDNTRGRRHSFHIGDTITAGRATINLGVRYDHQSSESLPSRVPAHVMAPEIFPAVSFPGFDPGLAWSSLSPRVGMTYDVGGDARTLFRLNLARYASQASITEFHVTNTNAGSEMDFEWNDLNGNLSVDPGELGDVVWISPGFDPLHPNAPSSNQVNPTDPPWTNELIVGFERELGRSFGVGANVIHRRAGGFTWNPRAGEDDPSFWRPATQDVNGYGELTVYEPAVPRANYTIYKQRDNYNEVYTGLQLFLKKRFTGRWMANASFTLSDNVANFDGPGSYDDPTNIARLDGRPVSRGSRFGRWGAARWYLKGSAMVQLPAGVSLAGFAQVREGAINATEVYSRNRANQAGRVRTLIEDFGATRLPTFWNVDLRAEKTFDLAYRGRMHLIVDAFNLTNNDIILGQNPTMNSTSYGTITDVLQGRTVRLGMRLVLR